MAMAIANGWTLDDLHRLPDDGNKYEVVRGELFVTPPPSTDHEDVIARLNRILVPYVEANGLGHVYLARSVVRFEGSEVEPDVSVRESIRGFGNRWQDAPTPILTVEVLSGATRRRDPGPKRALYRDAGIAEYWIVDRERRSILVIKADAADCLVTDEMVWVPERAARELRFTVAELFE